jgi:hypothetical protein
VACAVMLASSIFDAYPSGLPPCGSAGRYIAPANRLDPRTSGPATDLPGGCAERDVGDNRHPGPVKCNALLAAASWTGQFR